MNVDTLRTWLLLVLGGLSALAGLVWAEPEFVTAGFAALGAEPLFQARREVAA